MRHRGHELHRRRGHIDIGNEDAGKELLLDAVLCKAAHLLDANVRVVAKLDPDGPNLDTGIRLLRWIARRRVLGLHLGRRTRRKLELAATGIASMSVASQQGKAGTATYSTVPSVDSNLSLKSSKFISTSSSANSYPRSRTISCTVLHARQSRTASFCPASRARSAANSSAMSRWNYLDGRQCSLVEMRWLICAG